MDKRENRIRCKSINSMDEFSKWYKEKLKHK